MNQHEYRSHLIHTSGNSISCIHFIFEKQCGAISHAYEGPAQWPTPWANSTTSCNMICVCDRRDGQHLAISERHDAIWCACAESARWPTPCDDWTTFCNMSSFLCNTQFLTEQSRDVYTTLSTHTCQRQCDADRTSSTLNNPYCDDNISMRACSADYVCVTVCTLNYKYWYTRVQVRAVRVVAL